MNEWRQFLRESNANSLAEHEFDHGAAVVALPSFVRTPEPGRSRTGEYSKRKPLKGLVNPAPGFQLPAPCKLLIS